MLLSQHLLASIKIKICLLTVLQMAWITTPLVMWKLWIFSYTTVGYYLSIFDTGVTVAENIRFILCIHQRELRIFENCLYEN